MVADEVHLSENEITALRQMRAGLLASRVPDRNDRGDFGEVVPGAGVFRRLARRGLCFLTEEDQLPMDDGSDFHFTPSWELTDEGKRALEQALKPAPRPRATALR